MDMLNKMDEIHFIHASDKYFYNYDKMLNTLSNLTDWFNAWEDFALRQGFATK